MVIIAGTLVPREYISTALGMHKSTEMAGTTIAQTLTGLLLDIKPMDKPPIVAPSSGKQSVRGLIELVVTAGSKRAVVRALRAFLSIAVLQTLSVAFLWWLTRRSAQGKSHEREAGYHPIQSHDDIALADSPMSEHAAPLDDAVPSASSSGMRLRGRIGLVASLSVIALAWIVFWGSAFVERN